MDFSPGSLDKPNADGGSTIRKRCPNCHKRFSNIDFGDHILSCNEKIPNDDDNNNELANCPICHEYFTSTYIENHLQNCLDKKKIEEDRPKQCSFCHEYFGALDLLNHQKTCKPNGNIGGDNGIKQCPVCKEYFGAVDLANHQKACQPNVDNGGDNGIKLCPVCKEHFGAMDLANHQKTCQANGNNGAGNGIKRCPVCKEYFGAVDYTAHFKTCEKEEVKAEDNVIQCPTCNDYFGLLDFSEHEKNCKRRKPLEEEKLETCPYCKDLFGSIDIKDHKRYCDKALGIQEQLKECPICNDIFGALDFWDHQQICRPKKIKTDKDLLNELTSENVKQCPMCSEYFGKADLRSHEDECKKNKKKLDEDQKLAIELGRSSLSGSLVNDLQLKALLYVQGASKIKSLAAYPKLLDRLKKFGKTEEDLDKTLTYIRTKAQIIIHFTPQVALPFYLKDTNYRNGFETSLSGKPRFLNTHTARAGWEDRCFNNIYKNAKPVERVKYGVLNIVNDPNGVQACRGYGDSYLALNCESVSLRTTFASGDTAGMVELASCENYAHVLMTYTDAELKGVISVATGELNCMDSQVVGVYKEVQVHGPILFNRDVVAVVLQSHYKSNPTVVENAELFAKQNNINLIWMEPNMTPGGPLSGLLPHIGPKMPVVPKIPVKPLPHKPGIKPYSKGPFYKN